MNALGAHVPLCKQLLGIRAKPRNPTSAHSQSASKQEGQLRYTGDSARVQAPIQHGDVKKERKAM